MTEKDIIISWIYNPRPEVIITFNTWKECKLILGTNRARRLVKEGKLIRKEE